MRVSFNIFLWIWSCKIEQNDARKRFKERIRRIKSFFLSLFVRIDHDLYRNCPFRWYISWSCHALQEFRPKIIPNITITITQWDPGWPTDASIKHYITFKKKSLQLFVCLLVLVVVLFSIWQKDRWLIVSLRNSEFEQCTCTEIVNSRIANGSFWFLKVHFLNYTIWVWELLFHRTIP